MTTTYRVLIPCVAVLCAVAGYASGRVAGQTPAAKTFVSPGGTQLKVLVDSASLGGNEVEVGELTFAPNSDSGDHQHGVTETFYLLEGDLEQVVNGKAIKLTPGMAVSIRSTDHVVHRTGPKGARALVIWAPGGEIARVTGRWKAK
jgi:quercetin dioxygenase-like cupin family protein